MMVGSALYGEDFRICVDYLNGNKRNFEISFGDLTLHPAHNTWFISRHKFVYI